MSMKTILGSREELAWAAGFFDGEGTVSWAKNVHGRGTFTIKISQLDTETLNRFRAAVGTGTIGGPYPNGKRNNGAAYIYQWRQSGPLGVDAFNAIRPYLSSIKRKQGDYALQKRLENLALRRKRATNNTSGYPNVVWSKHKNKWIAYCNINGRRVHAGSAVTKEIAYSMQQQRYSLSQ